MTQRTFSQIEAAIDVVTKMVNEVDDFLRNLRNEPAKGDLVVLGFPEYGFWLGREGKLTNVLNARLMDAHTAARITVRNGKGEHAVVCTYEHALDEAITRQENLHTTLCGGLRDLYHERADALFAEGEAANAAAAAYEAEQDYYGMAEERARHP